ncbi:hypothetical protein [Palaeococcus sp. (in: euryarchaeotes)]
MKTEVIGGFMMVSPSPPPIIGDRRESLNPEFVERAVETVRAALPFFTAGVPIIRRGPAGEIHVDAPIMYMDFAIDRMHYDPYARAPSPKGRPVRAWGIEVDPREVRVIVNSALKEARVIEAAEFREPEDAWAIPVAWGKFIILHVKVSYDGKELIPDYGLTEEVRRYVI